MTEEDYHCDPVEIVGIGNRRIERGKMSRPIITMGYMTTFCCATCGDRLSGKRYIVEEEGVRHCLNCVEYVQMEEEDD